MPDDFVIARNPEEGTTLPYLLRIPLGPDGIVLKAKETWPRTGNVYCHRAVDHVCETRALAQEWTYRFLAAAVVHAGGHQHVYTEATALPSTAPPSTAEVRQSARSQGYAVPDRGRISGAVLEAFARRHQ